MSTDKITVRMDLDSWNQITHDLEKFYSMNVEETEIWESVEIQRDGGVWSSPTQEWASGL